MSCLIGLGVAIHQCWANRRLLNGLKQIAWLLACFDVDRKRAVAKYIDFVRVGIGLPPVWDDLKYQVYLGSDQFIETVQNVLADCTKNDLSEISRLQRRLLAKPLQWYEDNEPNRKRAMALSYVSGHYSMKEISLWFGCHYSTVSRAIKSFEMES